MPISTKEATSVAAVCFSVHQAPSEKGSTLKVKNLLPMGANSFLLEQTSFQMRGKHQSDKVAFPSSVFFPLKTQA